MVDDSAHTKTVLACILFTFAAMVTVLYASTIWMHDINPDTSQDGYTVDVKRQETELTRDSIGLTEMGLDELAIAVLSVDGEELSDVAKAEAKVDVKLFSQSWEIPKDMGSFKEVGMVGDCDGNSA